MHGSLASLQVRSTLGSWKEAFFFFLGNQLWNLPRVPRAAGTRQEQLPGGGPPRQVPVQPLPTCRRVPPRAAPVRSQAGFFGCTKLLGVGTPCDAHMRWARQGVWGAEEGRQRRGSPWPPWAWSPAPIGVRQRHETAQHMVL